MHTEQNDFDLKVRQIMDGAQEAVPARLWRGIYARMGAAAPVAKSSGAPLARRLGYGLLAIAASALLLLVSGLFNSENNQTNTLSKNYSTEVVQAGAAQQAEAARPIPAAPVVPVAPVAPASPDVAEIAYTPAAPELALTPADAPAKLLAEAAEETPPSAAEEETAAAPVVEEKSKAWEETQDFIDFTDNTPPKKRSSLFGITVGGNFQSNGITATAAPSQIRRASVGAKPTTSSVRETGESHYLLPLTFSLGLHFPVHKYISLGSGLSYTFLHRNFSGMYTNVGNGSINTYESDDIDHNLHYLGIPLGIYVNILGAESSRLRLYTFASGMMEFALSNKYVIHVGDKVYTLTKDTDGVQFSLSGGFGLEYCFNKHLGIYADPSIRYYFDCNQPKSIRTQQPWMMGLEVGVRFKL